MKKKKGFTLVEVMIVSGIIVVAVAGLCQVFITALNAIDDAKALNIAVDDIKDVLEKMNNVPFSVSTRVFDGVPEADVNGAFIEDGTDQVAAGDIGGFLLDNEQISVSFPQVINNPAAPVLVIDLPDPLEVLVSISWTVKGRVRNKAYRAIRTRLM